METRRTLWPTSTSARRASKIKSPVLRSIDPPSSVETYPFILETRIDEYEEILYEDLSTPPKKCQLPTGNLFNDPFKSRRSSETVVVSQFEDGLSWSKVRSRLFTTNKSTWNGQDPDKWMIIGIEWHSCRVPTGASGSLSNTFYARYTIKLSERNDGWLSSRALIDREYFPTGKTNPDDRVPFSNNNAGGRVNHYGLLKANGEKLEPQTAAPVYDTWRVQSQIEFDFLRPT